MKKKQRLVGYRRKPSDQVPEPRGRQWTEGPALYQGYIEVFGYSTAAAGWLFSGWVPRPFNIAHLEPVDCLAQYDKSKCWGQAVLVFYQRKDLDQHSIGLVAYLPSNEIVVGSLQHVAFCLDGAKFQAQAGHFTARLIDQEIVERVRHNLMNQASSDRNRDHLLDVTTRRGYSGQDTLSALSEPVLLEIDHAIPCPPDGVLLKGWLLCRSGVIRAIRVRSGPLATPIEPSQGICVDRADVIEAIGASKGFSNPRCGFIIYVPRALSNGDLCYLEVELENGEVGFKSLLIPKRHGVDAIQRILDGVRIPYGGLDAAFDRTLGPAVTSVNDALREHAISASRIDFGKAPPRPQSSVVISLYGRVDFMEYQLALFSQSWDASRNELLYVLDDPSKQNELEILARSTYERFGIPFSVLSLSANAGFAAANNVGLRNAKGQIVCFLNSDVFPITGDWLYKLGADLERNPRIGVVGARLLFEDGSIQHEGCYHRKLSEFDNWWFVEHLNKGRRPEPCRDIRIRDAITGACMVMKRDLAEELGGFDEAFIIGDFEDSDLCLRVRRKGLSCAIDLGVEMHHLERKSQAPSNLSWRMNLTLYNAWLHQRRWGTSHGSPLRSAGGPS